MLRSDGGDAPTNTGGVETQLDLSADVPSSPCPITMALGSCACRPSPQLSSFWLVEHRPECMLGHCGGCLQCGLENTALAVFLEDDQLCWANLLTLVGDVWGLARHEGHSGVGYAQGATLLCLAA